MSDKEELLSDMPQSFVANITCDGDGAKRILVSAEHSRLPVAGDYIMVNGRERVVVRVGGPSYALGLAETMYYRHGWGRRPRSIGSERVTIEFHD